MNTNVEKSEFESFNYIITQHPIYLCIFLWLYSSEEILDHTGKLL